MISYGGREELVRAARILAERVQRGELEPDEIDEMALERLVHRASCRRPTC
jgi:undecaprenyl diphosphate synthase